MLKEKSQNTAKMYRKLLVGAAALGFHSFVITQSARNFFIPSSFQALFPLRFVHALPAADSHIVNQPEANNLRRGQFYLQGCGLMTEDGNNPLCAFPYIGDAPIFDQFVYTEKRKL